jgi:hypothetical protein
MMNRIKLAALFSQMVLVSATSFECAKPFDQQFFMFQNEIRTNPTAFIPFLRNFKDEFFGMYGKEYYSI